jgi:hypothetical protein
MKFPGRSKPIGGSDISGQSRAGEIKEEGKLPDPKRLKSCQAARKSNYLLKKGDRKVPESNPRSARNEGQSARMKNGRSESEMAL